MFATFQDRKSRFWRKFCMLLMLPVFAGLVFSAPVLAHASTPSQESQNIESEVLPVSLSGQAGDGQAALSWIDSNPSNDLAGYQIIFSVKPVLSFDPPIYTGLLQVGLVTKETVFGLENGTEYYFKIGRVEQNGTISGESEMIKVMPLDLVAPLTTLISSPSLPQGENHWFTSVPEISLTSSEPANTYYQWNTTENDGWQLYIAPLSAREGENILYYYSIDTAGNIEATHWQIFKVDVTAPEALVLSGIWDETNSGVSLSWNANPDVARVDIWQVLPSKTLVASVPANQYFYLQQLVNRGESYAYQLLGYDVAGNATESNTVLLTVPSPIATKAVASQAQVASKVEPAIGEGISTTAEETQVSENQPAVEGVQDQVPVENQDNSNGWNRLLVALSILIVAAGVAVGGYYGYEWMNEKSDRNDSNKDSRW